MQRRTFISLIGGAIAAWPLAARAQQPGKTYRVGLLATGGAIGPGDERRKAILEVLAAHGFVEGRNLAFEAKWVTGGTIA
jgi:putative tryptophan/tyrosine transport system substrate-binding protein